MEAHVSRDDAITPNGSRIFAQRYGADAHRWGPEMIDITEAVQVMYDLVVGSMDWGSGFLSIEDVEPMLHAARACGFDSERVENYMISRGQDQLVGLVKVPSWGEVTPEEYDEACREDRRKAWEAAKAEFRAKYGGPSVDHDDVERGGGQ